MAEAILERFAKLNLDESDKKSQIVRGYYLKLKQEKDPCLKELGKQKGTYFLLSRLVTERGVLVLCHKCMDTRTVASVSKDCNLDTFKKTSCEHALVCYLLWSTEELSTIGMDNDNNDDKV